MTNETNNTTTYIKYNHNTKQYIKVSCYDNMMVVVKSTIGNKATEKPHNKTMWADMGICEVTA